MRIVGGRNRGRTIAAPPGRDIRPTADRVRESVFNILEHGAAGNPDGARVLDGFAGTGAMGLEALSRGAAFATFMDTDISACRANIEALGETESTDTFRADCLAPPRATAPCSLIFLDPPYNSGLAAPALEALAAAGWISDGAVCVIELASKETFDPPAGFTVTDDRRYGAARVVFATRDAP